MIHIFADGVNFIDGFNKFFKVRAVCGVAESRKVAFYKVDDFPCRCDFSLEKRVGLNPAEAVFVFVVDIEGIREIEIRIDDKFKLIQAAVDFPDLGCAQLTAGHFDNIAVNVVDDHGFFSFFIYIYIAKRSSR